MAKFTRQHYEVIADVCKRTQVPIGTVSEFARIFGDDNARFNRDLFLKACGRKAAFEVVVNGKKSVAHATCETEARARLGVGKNVEVRLLGEAMEHRERVQDPVCDNCGIDVLVVRVDDSMLCACCADLSE